MIRFFLLLVVSICALGSPVVAQEVVEATASAKVDQAQRTAVEKLILRHFPDLDKDVLAGWADSYAELPLADLQQLLAQKAMLPRFDAVGTFLDGHAAELDAPDVASQKLYLSAIRTILRHNILHAETPGHRRQLVTTMVPELSAGIDGSNIQLAPAAFDFTAAAATPSGHRLHVALSDRSADRTMFRLEPGCILTRCGRFQRLADGRIGIKLGTQSLALYGDITIPEGITDAYIDTTGLVSHVTTPANKEKRVRVEFGQIQVAVIDDVTLLQSHNGVFFELPLDKIDEQVHMTTKMSLASRALEQSNVKVEQEIDRMKRVDFLSRP
jgi:flagellar basal body rod protein FlgG